MINELPKRLKKQREKHNLSQKQVAQKLYISPSIISGYELGTRTPSTEILLSLARLYHCSTDYLLGNNTTAIHFSLDTAGISDEQLKALQALINTMRNR